MKRFVLLFCFIVSALQTLIFCILVANEDDVLCRNEDDVLCRNEDDMFVFIAGEWRYNCNKKSCPISEAAL